MRAGQPEEETRDTYINDENNPINPEFSERRPNPKYDKSRQYHLLIQSIGRQPYTETLATGKNLIGRSNKCMIKLPLNDISRIHCTIIVSNGLVTIRNESSSNGTYVDGYRIQEEVPLTVGQSIQAGSVIMRLCQ